MVFHRGKDVDETPMVNVFSHFEELPVAAYVGSEPLWAIEKSYMDQLFQRDGILRNSNELR